METNFGATAPYTVSVEDEFQLVNAQSFGLPPVIDAVLAKLPNLLPDFVRFTCNRYFSIAAYLYVPKVSILPQVLTQAHQAPIFLYTHGGDARMQRLIFRTLPGNGGVREEQAL